MADPHRVYCVCTGCGERECNAATSRPCNRNREWASLAEMKALGWRQRKRERWICPTCIEGSRKKRDVPKRSTGRQTRIERTDNPIWLGRGAELLEYLSEKRTWPQMQSWAAKVGYNTQVLRNIMACVDDQMVYSDGTWCATEPKPKFERVPPGPSSTLRARLAYEML